MNSCTICKLPVLELEGQFENLEPYYAEPGDPAAELVGECHSSCIAGSAYGRAWFDWRVHNYSTGRGYRIAVEQGGWTVLVHKRHPELLAFHVGGFSVGGERASRRGVEKVVDGGILVPVDEEFNLAWDNTEMMADLKSRLKHDGKYSILAMLNVLGVADRIKWPQALENASFVLDPKLQKDWTSTALGMRARYTKFLPDPVLPLWRSL